MNSIIHPETGFSQEYRTLFKGDNKMVRNKSFSNEFGIIAQGVGNIVAGSNTIFFISKSQVPQCDIKPQKYETYITRITFVGNIIEYPGEVTTTTSYIKTAKTLINSTISTPDSLFCVQI